MEKSVPLKKNLAGSDFMLDDVQVKVKKSKKEKKQKRADYDEDNYGEPQVDLPKEVEDEEIPVKVKKEKKDKKKKREALLEEDSELFADEATEIVVESELKEKKKEKRDKKEKNEPDLAPVEEAPETPKVKKSKTEKKQENDEVNTHDVSIATPMASENHDEDTGGAKYWRRLDVEKYQNVVAGTRYADNSHYAKGGDSWGNDAADRLGQVRGKGFKKEMQKLKRASWKGCGSIDTGVNSVQFSDWEE